MADPQTRCDGVCYDGAFRGTHIDHAMKHGLTVLSPIHDGIRKPTAHVAVYDRCYGWREDSESLNNTLDRTLYGGRMIAYTAVRQLIVMLGFALGRNAIAVYLHRRRHPSERAA